MIKLIFVFDKMVRVNLSEGAEFFTGPTGRKRIRELILDEVSNIDVDQIVCPACGSEGVIWEYQYTSKRKFIWDNPEEPIHVGLPYYLYHCNKCRAVKHEEITTDLTIDRTDLSYHYLFHLLRTKKFSCDMDLLELDNLLYGNFSEEALKVWKVRFDRDFERLSHLPRLDLQQFLGEQVEAGNSFIQFYLRERRFFLQSSMPEMIIWTDRFGNVRCLRGLEESLKA